MIFNVFSTMLMVCFDSLQKKREINYSLKFAPVLNCELLLVQDVPSSVYIDNDQLLNLNKLNKVSMFIKLANT